ncbi:hypothetical protein PHMEG_00027441 [Phytophthora megakarya]|uniref:Reverse transcriptase n=1 Tax=Phytophthora megakarya TaxID=4795 RepID=A0A225V7D8_9STRA|nr:hypothetical protein PHMEG_00027441 [Phytophthora megakarya]
MAHSALPRRSENTHIFPVVHVSKIKLVKIFPDRPVAHLNGSEGDWVGFDEALLPEDSWIQDRDPDE